MNANRIRQAGFLALLCGACLAWAVCAGEAPPEKPLDSSSLPKQYGGLPLLWAPKVGDLEKLAGDLSAPVWKQAAQVEMVDCVSGATPKIPTTLYVYCSDHALYFGFRCREPKPNGLVTAGGEIWSHDEVEIFFEPHKDTLKKCYHQLIVNAAADKWHGRVHLYPKHQNMQLREEWNPRFEAAAKVGNDAWTLEVKVPYNQMKLTEEAKKKNTLWRLNLYRHRPQKDEEPRMTWAWSPPGDPAFHTPMKFGYLLPESHASAKLIARIAEEARAEAELRAQPLGLELDWEIRKRAAELAAPLFAERAAAAERLLSIHTTHPTGALRVREVLDVLCQSSRDAHLVAAAGALLGQLKQSSEGGEDPIPDQFLRRSR